ncbi:ATP-dependent DNA helicase [Butyrivibrio sp. AC2005]|uniref:ATP-dependent DNA helicase n=1 Tax=Butyrivibrio sp. AC2005 TaxID=1280672 RepID=UPI00041990BA|nr:AAA family ATPase [Butyrivibrio sp. AC2005]
MIDVLKVVKDYIDETGCTWYKPQPKYKHLFDGGVKRKVLVEESGYYSLPEISRQEKKIAKNAVVRTHYNEDTRTTYPKSFLDMFIALYEEQEGINLDEWQKDAVYRAVNNNLFILTGGPGTGKTATLKCILYCLRKTLKTEDIVFTAPTGKAARRITESVGCPACTVAKALGLRDETSVPKKLNNACLIVDEISMLDTVTACALFSATSPETKLILVGDIDQLPSVGYGSVLRDLIDADLPCTKLEKTFRQASESGLFANIAGIKSGLHAGFEERDDFKVLKAKNTSETKDIMVREFLEAADKYGTSNVVCLTPYRRKGDACAIKLNAVLQDIINPPKNGSLCVTYTTEEEDGYRYEQKLRIGDPVMQLVNAEKVANGDVGNVCEIDKEHQKVKVKFIDCTVTYGINQLSQLALSYAMSVHKSQGSEYPCVITSALSGDLQMLSRNTIYTAVTRAKQKCIVVTDDETAQKACKKETGYERITRLSEEINHQKSRYELFLKLM